MLQCATVRTHDSSATKSGQLNTPKGNTRISTSTRFISVNTRISTSTPKLESQLTSAAWILHGVFTSRKVAEKLL
jgi:hypothetical protein